MRKSYLVAFLAVTILGSYPVATAQQVNSDGTAEETKESCKIKSASCWFSCDTKHTNGITGAKDHKKIKDCRKGCARREKKCIRRVEGGGERPQRTVRPSQDARPTGGGILDPGPGLGTQGPAGTGAPIGGGKSPPPPTKIF